MVGTALMQANLVEILQMKANGLFLAYLPITPKKINGFNSKCTLEITKINLLKLSVLELVLIIDSFVIYYLPSLRHNVVVHKAPI